MIIFADILFAVNFIMDCLCLFVCGRVLNLKISRMRLVCAGVIGGIYGVVSALWALYEPLSGIIVSALMIIVCFNTSGVFMFVKTLLLMYCTGMLFGGIFTFLQRIIYENRSLPIFPDGAGLAVFALIFVVMLLFVMLSSALFRIYIHKKNVSCVLALNDREQKVKLLTDTGNMLRDPYTGKAVVIVKAEALDRLLGKDGVHRCFEKCTEGAFEGQLHFISAKTVAGTVLLPVVGAVRVYLCRRNGKRLELFAAVASDASGENDYGGNDGIMPYILL